MAKAEKVIKDYTRNCSNVEYKQGVYAPTYQPWLTPEQALSAVKIAREEMIESVIDILKVVDYKDYISSITNGVGAINFVSDKFVDDIKKTLTH